MAQVTQLPLPEEVKAAAMRKSKRQGRRLRVLAKAEQEALYSRQVAADLGDPFQQFYSKHQILAPPYTFAKLMRIYEESDILQTCVESMVNNVDGFGYEFIFQGDDIKDKEKPEAQARKESLSDFFAYINDTQSFTAVRKLMRTDLETLGNGGFEIVRNRMNKPQMFFHVPFSTIRLTLKDKKAVTVDAYIPRDGSLVKVKVRKYFRKFVQLSESGKTLRWFKEFGDPRPMSAVTGQYGTTGKGSASEIWHFKLPFNGMAYGLPRYIGPILEVVGRRNAQYVNYDLFENQGIPPFMILVSGGTLTDDSYDELDAFLESLKGTQHFNKATILEATPEAVGIEDKGSVKVEMKGMTEFRKDDAMFTQYSEGTEKKHSAPLPPS